MVQCPSCKEKVTFFSQLGVSKKYHQPFIRKFFNFLENNVICRNCNERLKITNEAYWMFRLGFIILGVISWLCFGLIDYLFLEPYLSSHLHGHYYDLLGGLFFLIVAICSMSISWEYFVKLKRIDS